MELLLSLIPDCKKYPPPDCNVLIELIIIIQQQSQFIFSCSQVEGEHEAGPEWDFLYLWRNGVIPADLCHRDKYC